MRTMWHKVRQYCTSTTPTPTSTPAPAATSSNGQADLPPTRRRGRRARLFDAAAAHPGLGLPGCYLAAAWAGLHKPGRPLAARPHSDMPKPRDLAELAPLPKTAIMRAFARATQRCVIFDYDGTVQPYGISKEAPPPPELLDAIDRLAAMPNTVVVVNSARGRERLLEFFGDLPMLLIAEEGSSWKLPQEARWTAHPATPKDPNWCAPARSLMEHLAAKFAGAQVHYNGATRLVLRYQEVAPERLQDLLDTIGDKLLPRLEALSESALLPVALNVRHEQHNKALLVMPAEINKGTALRAIEQTKRVPLLMPSGARRLTLLMGDAKADEAMFLQARRTPETVSIRVWDQNADRQRAAPLTYATFVLSSPVEVRALLTQLGGGEDGAIAAWRTQPKTTDFLLDLARRPTLRRALRTDANFNDIDAVGYESDLARAVMRTFTAQAAAPWREPMQRASRHLWQTVICPARAAGLSAILEPLRQRMSEACGHPGRYRGEPLPLAAARANANRNSDAPAAMNLPTSLTPDAFWHWLEAQLWSDEGSAFVTQMLFLRLFGEHVPFVPDSPCRAAMLAIYGLSAAATADLTADNLRRQTLQPSELFGATGRPEGATAPAHLPVKRPAARLPWPRTAKNLPLTRSFGTRSDSRWSCPPVLANVDAAQHCAAWTLYAVPAGSASTSAVAAARARNLPLNSGFSAATHAIMLAGLLGGIPRGSAEGDLLKAAAIAYVVDCGDNAWHECALVTDYYGGAPYQADDFVASLPQPLRAAGRQLIEAVTAGYTITLQPNGFKSVRRNHTEAAA